MLCVKDNVVCDRVDLDGVEIDVCPHCDSVWLDGGELRRLTTLLASKREKRAAELVARWSELPEVGTTAPKDFWVEAMDRCPKDGTHMLKHYFPGTTIGLDHCPLCRGFWLDGAEFKAVLEETAPNEHEELLGRAFAREVGDTMRLRMGLEETRFDLSSRTMMAGLPLQAQGLVIGVVSLIAEFLSGARRQ
ncbi:hypothetical protein GVX82_04915 [Patescibacteria group bacterium]|jgi:Zn-finger nucleic acid-binding protein|nr:hypothetical protein [Patescibacteria group bacterium]